MKKLLTLTAILLLCVVAGWLGTSWFIGKKTEQVVRKHFQKDESSHVLIDYYPTFFGATAITRMDVRDTPLSTWVDELQLVHKIKNGPVFWQGDFDTVQAGLSEWKTTVDPDFLEEHLRERVAEVFAYAEPVQVKSLVDFERRIAYQMEINPMNSVAEDGQEFRLDGAQLAGTFNPGNRGEDTFTLHTGLSVFTIEEASLTVPGVSVVSGGSAVSEEALSFNAEQVAIRMTGEPEAISFNLRGKSTNTREGENLAGQVNLSLDSFDGVRYPLQQLDLDLSYEGINSAGLTRANLLQTRLQDLQAQLGWNEEEIEMPEARRKINQLELEMREVAGHLLDTVFSEALQKDNSRFKAELKLETEDGDILNEADLTYAGTESRISLETIMNYGPEDWSKLFRGEIDVDAAQAAIPGELKFLLLYPIDKQAVIDDGERYLMNLRLVGSDVELNERVVAFSDLPGKFMPQAPVAAENSGVDIPSDILAMIETKGLTPEVMQELEDNDEVSADALEMLRQFKAMSEQLK